MMMCVWCVFKIRMWMMSMEKKLKRGAHVKEIEKKSYYKKFNDVEFFNTLKFSYVKWKEIECECACER